LGLYEEMKRRVPEMTRSQYAILAVDWIFERPVFKSTDFVESSGIPRASARRLLPVLRDGEVVRTLTAGRGSRPAVYAFADLLRIAEGRDIV
ncbi:MAG: hypothetical protein RLN75_06565, partial [Longimicrobiales bacterium]